MCLKHIKDLPAFCKTRRGVKPAKGTRHECPFHKMTDTKQKTDRDLEALSALGDQRRWKGFSFGAGPRGVIGQVSSKHTVLAERTQILL
jgi:hypothetical protein